MAVAVVSLLVGGGDVVLEELERDAEVALGEPVRTQQLVELLRERAERYRHARRLRRVRREAQVLRVQCELVACIVSYIRIVSYRIATRIRSTIASSKQSQPQRLK